MLRSYLSNILNGVAMVMLHHTNRKCGIISPNNVSRSSVMRCNRNTRCLDPLIAAWSLTPTHFLLLSFIARWECWECWESSTDRLNQSYKRCVSEASGLFAEFLFVYRLSVFAVT